ncbi:MAG: SpoIIE family protein phosphatase [Treponema sp.]
MTNETSTMTSLNATESPCEAQQKDEIQKNIGETFVEVDHFQLCKSGQHSPGDVFLSEKNPSDGRTISTLSDGLGSGIKADVLATLTATMATKFVANDIPIKRAAEIIMNTLPVCSERGISYATFTTVDIDPNSTVKIIEYDNPPYLLVRQQTALDPIKESTEIVRKDKSTAPRMKAYLHYSKFTGEPGDRLVFFSDGVTQSGMGTALFPFGWTAENAYSFVLDRIKENPCVSARDLAKSVVQEACIHDGYKPKDDISCGVVYFRNPRDTLILTGPPISKESDKELASIFNLFNGKKVICGGTTANIMSRELKKPITVDMKNLDPEVPPFSEMEGADLVSEGIITLGTVADILENNGVYSSDKDNAATRMVEIFRNSDRIYFVVGTKINEAHQDPNMPEGLEIRRNVVKKVASLLEEKFLKETHIQYL